MYGYFCASWLRWTIYLNIILGIESVLHYPSCFSFATHSGFQSMQLHMTPFASCQFSNHHLIHYVSILHHLSLSPSVLFPPPSSHSLPKSSFACSTHSGLQSIHLRMTLLPLSQPPITTSYVMTAVVCVDDRATWASLCAWEREHSHVGLVMIIFF